MYAAQDIKDDAKAGIKSPVVLHQSHTRRILAYAAFIQITSLFIVGITIQATEVYFFVACLGAVLALGTMIIRVDLDDPRDCMWWFKNGCSYTGAVIGSGFIGEYMIRISQ